MNAKLLYDPPASAQPAAPVKDASAIWHQPAFWPVLVLVASLVATAIFWRNTRLDTVAELHEHFERQVYDIKSSIDAHLAAHALVLKGFEGLFNASGEVTRKDFRRYFETLELGDQNSGFPGIAYHNLVTAERLPAHVASVRREGFSEYQVHPQGARPVYAPLTYFEPFDDVNRKVLGFDPLTIEVERLAVERARDSGEVTISTKQTLAQEDGTAVPGFVMYVPLYAHAEALTTPTERRKAFVGWIDAPFRVQSLVAHIFPLGFGGLDLEIFDGTQRVADGLLYDSDGHLAAAGPLASQFQLEKQIFFGGHTWTLFVRALPSFGAAGVRQKPQLVASVGALLSVVLSLLTLALARALQRNALRAQRQAFKSLEIERNRQQEWLRLVLLASDAGTWE